MDDYKRKTIASYDAHAPLFAQKFQAMTDLHRRREFGDFINVLPGTRVLDMGCGAGDHAAYFMQQQLSVTAIDLSTEMVSLAKQKGVHASVMDIESLSFPKGSFDGVWAVTSLLHIPRKSIPSVLASIAEILVPEGVFYVCLKQGVGESYVPDASGDTERFFVFWEEQEFIDHSSPYFSLLSSEEVTLGDRTFLQFLFRKR